MKQLYLRIYLTVIAALALFALASGWLVQQHLDETRVRNESMLRERTAAWGELLQRSLPDASAPAAEQVAALREWSHRLRLPLALDDAQGRRLGSSDSFLRRAYDGPELGQRAQAISFEDGRRLWVPRPGGGGRLQTGGPGVLGDGLAAARGGVAPIRPWWAPWAPPGMSRMPEGLGLVALLVVLFLAVAAGAWPVVRRLTRRLEALKAGVEAFGAGDLKRRVAEEGRDEVGELAASFNRSAGRIEALLRSHQSLLANASHELRSPLARLKMAVALMEEQAPNPDAASAELARSARQALKREIDTNIAELDALVEEVLLASRLEGADDIGRKEALDFEALVVEECAKVGAVLSGHAPPAMAGVERLLRRALRNLLENARRYGQGAVEVQLLSSPQRGHVELRVCDRGPGVPEIYRERIFEPFFRLPGHAEREGGVGLGLALVRQIALRHGGQVRCEERAGGGSCFVLTLAAA